MALILESGSNNFHSLQFENVPESVSYRFINSSFRIMIPIPEEEMVPALKKLAILAIIDIRSHSLIKNNSILKISDNLLIDYYLELSKQNKSDDLKAELKDFSTFVRLLKNTKSRSELYHIYFTVTRINNCGGNHTIIKDYLNDFKLKVQVRDHNDDSVIALGYQIGCFLNEIAMFRDSSDFLNVTMDLCLQSNDYEAALSCCIKLLHSQTSFGLMKKAIQSYNLAQFLLQKLKYRFYNLVECHIVFSHYFYSTGNYPQALSYAVKAIHAINVKMCPELIVDLMNSASRASARKNYFALANKICRYSLPLSKGCCGEWSRFFIETLISQAQFRSFLKSYNESVEIYNSALRYSKLIFGEAGFYTGFCYAELSYAQYKKDYLTQRLDDANEYADKATEIMKLHTEPDNYCLASTERIKAVILEEISEFFDPLLGESLKLAEKIYLKVLKISMETFGEYSYHVAKLYAVLGRLYQTLNMLTISEKMQLKALQLKQNILDPDDYEVALSASYLGSLYVRLKKYRNAETHFKMSMDILKNIYGEFSPIIKSPLNSLIHIFAVMGNDHSRSIYTRKLDEVILKEEETLENQRLAYPNDPVGLEEVIMESFKTLW